MTWAPNRDLTRKNVMDEIKPDVHVDPSPTPVPEPVREDVPTPPAPPAPQPKAEDRSVPYERFKEVNDELARLKKAPPATNTKSLEVDDFINISASLEGLDQREKQYLAEQHKLSGRPLTEIRNDENFLLWQSAYKAKVEKERAQLKPSSTQTDSDRPRSLADRLKGASLEEQEKILADAGLWKSPRPRADRVVLDRPQ